ncbi:MAG: sulfite exporter TauE/SafE family protein [Candidatus Omnitrophica bacterium]|nr:sulfite exporter TauE/SafE family protein [Candidatus Omnitrophota bacterium]
MIDIHNSNMDFSKRFSIDLKLMIVLLLTSILGAVIAGLLAGIIPQVWIRLYIGVMIIVMGIIILFFRDRDFGFSWIKLLILGLIASFNKGLTGGGYGPLIVSGQIISGISSKRAVGITSLAEGLTCFVGALTYIITLQKYLDMSLVFYVVLGAVCAIPLSSFTVKKISSKKLKVIIGIVTVILGGFTLIKIILK